MPEDLKSLILDLRDEKAVELVRKRIEQGEDAMTILGEVREAMDAVGQRFENKEFFLPDLLMSGEILKDITEILEPKLKAGREEEHKGEIILGTVKGDIHDIGKDIVKFMLESNGFKVIDLGVDVPKEKFIEKIKEADAKVLALSGFLTLAFDSMKETIEEIKNQGLRDKVKIMIGGGQMNEDLREYTGADAFGKDAMKAVSLAKQWTAS